MSASIFKYFINVPCYLQKIRSVSICFILLKYYSIVYILFGKYFQLAWAVIFRVFYSLVSISLLV